MSKRIALVTGGVGGIGRAICIELAKMDYTVFATHLELEQESASEWLRSVPEYQNLIHLVKCDVVNIEECEAVVSEIEQKSGGVDVLVNCAGITRDGVLKKMTPDQWSSVINTNLNSVFNTTRFVINGMLERQFGRIINIASVNGQKGQFGQTNYSAAKAGMHGFTMALAQETASKGVTVNTISPGYIGTAMVMSIAQDIRDKIVAQIPVGRLGKPEDIARAVAFLAHEDNSFITGANLSINGGQWMH